ncbi:S8 family serine peptidase [uncultured Microbacterium sp.]|uniref:S8 family peptidase n=1 Tax=uncultured Microbacterium sp. TaxID=191216 RepID=UPI0035CC4030
MTDLAPDDRSASSRPATSWRQRYEAARARGVALDPKSEPVRGVTAYPTSYDPDHLLITRTAYLDDLLAALRFAASDFGWGLELQTMDGAPTDRDPAIARAERARDELDLPTIYRVGIFPAPSPDRDDQPVPPIDAWRLLQRARARAGTDNLASLDGVSLDHVLWVDPVGGKTNPVGGKTNPVGGKTNPFGMVNAPGAESYVMPGSGGRQVVTYIGPDPTRTAELAPGGRRPVVAILDTGCGVHRWLPDDIVTRYPEFDDRVIGIAEPSTDPEVIGDVAGPFDGAIDESAGHGTFIAGIIRQVSPEADIIAIRVADSQGTVLEGDFMLAVRSLVKWMSLEPDKGGRQIDVINLSLGYYHETPEDGLFDQTLSELLIAARRRGCAVVCSSGNDATDRPSFPAALWAWPDAEFIVEDPADAAPHVSVGALNPNGTMALFSNLGPWVTTFAPGAAVMSCHPRFKGGVQAGTRDDRGGKRRETIDPDDFEGGFALWSGTSFAAPYVAGLLARAAGPSLMDGTLSNPGDRVSTLRKARTEIYKTLAEKGPTPA